MLRYFFVLALGLFLLAPLTAQKPVALRAFTLFHGKQVQAFELFNPSTEAKEDVLSYVRAARSFTIRPEVLQAIHQADAGMIQLILPEPLDIRLDLYRTSIYSAGARILTSDGRSYEPDRNILFYRGIIDGNVNSLAIVTILEDKVQIVFSDPYGNRRIQPAEDGSYILFYDQDIKVTKHIDCFTPDSGKPISLDDQKELDRRTMTGNCVEIYVEADHQSYLDNGSSVPNTEAWVASLFNEVTTLYANESIPIEVSDVLVYSNWDPFVGFNNTGDVLNAFRLHIDTLNYNGRLAHLLSTRTLGGGIGYVDVLCDNTYQCAFSANLTTTIIHFPTYSWNVEVVTHEMGHNFGSYHTHACVWNGNNTQIDDCGNVWAFNNGQPVEG
ncbi:MAG TPA: M12 family metallo-peptidase, partial [Saprospiraceae bacterium]|nr:M12 family metallo-peptidase [Saprospiraceae bacterium]